MKSIAGLKGNPQLTARSLPNLFFKGLSLRVIEDFLKKTYQVQVSYPTIHLLGPPHDTAIEQAREGTQSTRRKPMAYRRNHSESQGRAAVPMERA